MNNFQYRAGFVTILGRPNVGKSTLTNALVGEKIAITSSKPQTTRRAIRGIVSRADGQIILLDTPGVHRPKTLLGERLNDVVRSTLADTDVIAQCFSAQDIVGSGDRFISESFSQLRHKKTVAFITKTDICSNEKIANTLIEVAKLRDWDAFVPVSAVSGSQVDIALDTLMGFLPQSEMPLYPVEDVTDQDIFERISDLVREAALEGLNDEMPHSLAVTVDEIVPESAEQIARVFVNVFVERDSQKGILIGKSGSRLKEIGSEARAGIEKLLGYRVFLSIRVKVAKDWQKDPQALGKLGF